ncbi:acyl-CoA thioesterase II [Pasteurellaceae bacterium RH1A]|nr:acyl-CoA thioesterase II [Pasteurellaceae bacterium RH1A]
MTALEKLIDILTLSPLSQNRFEGKHIDLGLPNVFGGQIIGQSLAAAMQCVPAERVVHSCHIYFLQAGKLDAPLEYEVEVLREGKSFTTVEVKAEQFQQTVSKMLLSFHVDEGGLEHQASMPDVAEPEDFASENELIQALAKFLPPVLQEKFLAERPFDIRVKHVNNPLQGQKLPPEQFVWFKAQGQAPANLRLQQCLLAYFTDFHSLITALHPHEKGFMQQGVKIATLDHAIWFHREFSLNDWLLSALESNNARNAKGLTRGQIFDKNGRLIATIQQEGVIRV